MNMLFRTGLTLTSIVVSTLFATVVWADTTLTYQSADGQFTVDLRPGVVRIDDAGDAWQLYESDSDTIFSVQPRQRSYTRLDQDTAGAVRARMNALRTQIENRVQKLPQGQQGAARAAMVEQIPGLDTRRHKIGLDHTGQTDTVAGIPCEVVQVVRDGRPAETLCVAKANALGISDDSFTTVKSMFQLMKNMLAGTGLETVGLPYLQLAGMPVRFVDAASGERRQLTRVSHDEIADSRFEIPKNYIEQAPQQLGP